MDNRIYALTFTPVLRDYIWGGRNLERLFGRRLPPGRVAESWEISGHPNAVTLADNGFWAGQPLPAILGQLGQRLVGRRAEWALQRGKFPLLVKLLDANDDLSVQVHPDDIYARAHENDELGKTEMWYILHAEPGAELIWGLQPGVNPERFRQALLAGELSSVLRRLPIRPGQAVDVPTGTVHALLRGVVATEIQQNSDTTYRVYDWGRVGADGKPRPLHVEKALDVINWDGVSGRVAAPEVSARAGGISQAVLSANRYFVVEEVKLEPGAEFRSACDGTTMEIWGCVAGHAQVQSAQGPTLDLPSIRYTLLPAALGEFCVSAPAGATCLRVYLP